jgi:hypothetical protein
LNFSFQRFVCAGCSSRLRSGRTSRTRAAANDYVYGKLEVSLRRKLGWKLTTDPHKDFFRWSDTSARTRRIANRRRQFVRKQPSAWIGNQ